MSLKKYMIEEIKILLPKELKNRIESYEYLKKMPKRGMDTSAVENLGKYENLGFTPF